MQPKDWLAPLCALLGVVATVLYNQYRTWAEAKKAGSATVTVAEIDASDKLQERLLRRVMDLESKVDKVNDLLRESHDKEDECLRINARLEIKLSGLEALVLSLQQQVAQATSVR